MRDFFSSIFFKIILGIFIISLGAAAYTFSYSGTTSPITNITGTILLPLQSAFANTATFFSNVYTKSFEFDEVMAENESLKEQISILNAKTREYEFALEENEHLKEILNISQVNQEFQMELCEIVGRDFSNTSSILTLDKGQNAGIEVGNAVITADGLVGYVTRVGINYSQVTTLIDPNFTIGALISRSRQVGICEGTLELLANDNLKFGYLDKNADVQIFDVIETSGITGIYPKGLAIGTIIDVTIEENGISKYTVIKPFVEIDELKQVYIIKEF